MDEYNIADFDEYTCFLESNKINVIDFVQEINFIIQHIDTKLDFIQLLEELHRISPALIPYTTNIKPENVCGVYIYLKFLLCDEKKKEEILQHSKCIVFMHYALVSSSGVILRCKMNLFLGFLYNLLNNETLSEFMDISDTYGSYIPLDTSKISNMTVNKEDCLSFSGFLHFIKFYERYNRAKILYRLIYILSKETNEKDARDDFIVRYFKNIDKFICARKFIRCIFHKYDKQVNHVIESNNSNFLQQENSNKNACNGENFLIYENPNYHETFINEHKCKLKNCSQKKTYKTEEEKESDIRSFFVDDLLLVDFFEKKFSGRWTTCLEKVFNLDIELDNPLNIISLINNNTIEQEMISCMINTQIKKKSIRNKIIDLEEKYVKCDDFKKLLQNIINA
jgi:hypothetical protein